MDDLLLVGVHDDGEHLLVAGPNGQRFRLRVDDALRAAVRRDRARLSQLQLESDGRLRPREIQARIRAGRTAQEVAEAAGLDLDHVRKFEGPVLAEREYVADQARQVRLRRAGSGSGGGATGGAGRPGVATGVGSAPATTLGQLVTERLGQREVDPETVSWDAWRADDGSWTLILTFEAGSCARTARWTYDPASRHVTAQDDEARWLSDETAPTGTPGQRRLAPVRERGAGDRAGERGGDTDGSPAASRTVEPPDQPAVDLLDTLRERRGRRTRPQPDDEDPTGPPDPVREAIDSLLSRADPAAPAPAPAPAVSGRPAVRTTIRAARSHPRDRPDGEVLILPDAAPLPGSPPVPGPPRDPEQALDADSGTGRDTDPDDARANAEHPVETPAARKQRRASVPSWDDIVFGQRRD